MTGCKGPIQCNQCYGVCGLISPMICQSTTADFTCKKEKKTFFLFVQHIAKYLDYETPLAGIFLEVTQEKCQLNFDQRSTKTLFWYMFHRDIFLVKNFESSCTYTGGEKTGWFSRSQERKYTKISSHQKCDIKQHSDAT